MNPPGSPQRQTTLYDLLIYGNYDVLRRFALGETIDIKRKDGHLIVDLFFQDESLCDWVDGEGTLDRVLGLYDDLLAEDYRPLFLSWLQAALLEHGWEPDAALAPVPPACRNFRRGIGR